MVSLALSLDARIDKELWFAFELASCVDLLVGIGLGLDITAWAMFRMRFCFRASVSAMVSFITRAISVWLSLKAMAMVLVRFWFMAKLVLLMGYSLE
jgi:hypothetical protein